MIIPKTYTIKTEKFLLRIPKEEDVDHIYSASQFQGFTDGMLWDPPEKIEELAGSVGRSIQAWENGDDFSFTIEDKHSNKFLGRISIRKTKTKDTWNIGFWTHPAEQRKGIMTEVVKYVINFGFGKLKAIKIEACFALWNKASEKVLLENGMKFERYIEKGFLKNGIWVAENVCSIELKNYRNLMYDSD